MSRPAFTGAQKQLKHSLLQKFNLEGAGPLAGEIEQLKTQFSAEREVALKTASETTGEAKRAATIAAKQATKSLQIVGVVAKTIRTLSKTEGEIAAGRALRAARKAAKLAASAPVVPETVAVAPVESAPVAEQASA